MWCSFSVLIYLNKEIERFNGILGSFHIFIEKVIIEFSLFSDLFIEKVINEFLIFQILKRLKIVALAKDEVECRVTAMPSFGLEVKTVLPHVLLAAMTSTYRLYQAPTQSLLSPLSSTPVSSTSVSVLNMSSQMLPATKVRILSFQYM